VPSFRRSAIVLAAFVVALAFTGSVPAADVSTAPRSLPGALWAVETGVASQGSAALNRLARSRVNALVVRRGSLTSAQLERLRARAAARGLPVFVPLRQSGTAAALVAECRALEVASPGSRCAVWAASRASALALARSRVVDVVFVRAPPSRLASLLGVHERVVGVAVLRGPPSPSWPSAVRTARSSRSTDLGAAPRGGGQARALSEFLRLLARLVARTDERPPRKPTGLASPGAVRTAVALAWREARTAVRYAVYRNGQRVGSATGRSFTVSGLSCGRSYLFEVDAVDRAGNRSPKAALVTATDACSSTGSPSAPPTVFVAPTGSDGSPCTKTAPCKSLDRAYHVAAPGETVEVAGGSYPSQTINAKAGAAPPHVLLRETPGARVVLGDEGATVGCLEFEGAQYVTVKGFETSYTTVGGQRHQCGVTIGRSDAHHVTLEDIDAGMIWFGADDVTVLGGDFGPGIDENTKIEFGTGHAPRNILIDGAVVHDQRRHQDHPECVALWGGSGITIRNSLFYNCEVFHLWIVANNETISDVLIEGNTFTQPDARLGIASTIKVGDHGGVLENVVLRGNRVLVDELYVLQGYGDGGVGDVHVLDNHVKEAIALGSGQSCMVDATYNPRPGVIYECRGNRLAVSARTR
jgi:hypothetical protein